MQGILKAVSNSAQGLAEATGLSAKKTTPVAAAAAPPPNASASAAPPPNASASAPPPPVVAAPPEPPNAAPPPPVSAPEPVVAAAAAAAPEPVVNQITFEDEEEFNKNQEEEEEKPKTKEKVPREKKARQIPVPKDSASFFRARAKDPKSFVFTKEGDLQVPEMRGELAKVISLPYYREATVEEIREYEEKQKDDIIAIEREIDETSRLLRDAMIAWRASGASSDVLKYQGDLQRLDAQRTQLRYPYRSLATYKNLAIRQIMMDEFYEVRKLGYPVMALKTRTMRLEDCVKVADGPPSSAPAPAEQQQVEGEEEEEEFTIFFDPADPDHGLLSPDTLVEFVFNATKYSSIIQAYEVERVTMLGRSGVRPRLLGTSKPSIVRQRAAEITGNVENPRELWINILKTLITQHPRFSEVLRSTDETTLVYADPRNGLLGVGLSAEDPAIMDKKSWKGENILGQAWKAVRDSLSEEPVLQKGGGAFTEQSRTVQQDNEVRAKIFMGKYRKNFV